MTRIFYIGKEFERQINTSFTSTSLGVKPFCVLIDALHMIQCKIDVIQRHSSKGVEIMNYTIYIVNAFHFITYRFS